MKKFIFFARVNVWLTFALPLAASAQYAGPYPNYVVIGAFAYQENAVEFTDDANKHNFQARFEMNPNRNLYYVYVLTTEDRKQAFAEALKLRTDTKYWDTWVYSGVLGQLGSQLTQSGGQDHDFNPITGQTIGSVGLESNVAVAGQTNSPEQRKDSGESQDREVTENPASDETDPNINHPDNPTAKNTTRKGKRADRRNAQSGDEKNSTQTSVDGAVISENSLPDKDNATGTSPQPGITTGSELVAGNSNNSVTVDRSVSDPSTEIETNLASTSGTQEQTSQNNLTTTGPQDQQDNTTAKNTTRKGKKITSGNKKNNQTGVEQKSTVPVPDGTVISENNVSEKDNTSQTSQQPGVTAVGKLVADTSNPVTGDKSNSDPNAETGPGLNAKTLDQKSQLESGNTNVPANGLQSQPDNTTAKNNTVSGKNQTAGTLGNVQSGNEKKSGTGTTEAGTVVAQNNLTATNNTSQTQRLAVNQDGKLVIETINSVTGERSVSDANAEITTGSGINGQTQDQRSQLETGKTNVTDAGLQSQPDNATARNNTASGKKQTAGTQGNVQSGNEKKSAGTVADASEISENNLTAKNNSSQTSQQPGVNNDGKLVTTTTDNSATGEKSNSDPSTETNLASTSDTQEQIGQNNLTATGQQDQQDNTTAKNTTRKGKKITSGNKKNTQTGVEQKSTVPVPDGTVISENNVSEKDKTSQTSQQPGVTTDGKLVADTSNPVTGDKSNSNPNAETGPGLNAKTLDQKSQLETGKTNVTANGLQSQPDNTTAKNNTASGQKQTAGTQGNVQSGNEKQSTGAVADGSEISQNNLTAKNNSSQTSQQPGVTRDRKLSTANTDNSTGEKSISDSNAEAVTGPGLAGDPQKEEIISTKEKNISETESKVGSIENTEERTIPQRVSTDPLSSEEVAGKNFYFQLYRADNRRVIEGEVDAIDFEKSRRMATYQANGSVKVLMPAGKSKQISFVSNVFGYRKMQKEFDPANPSEDLYLDADGNLVVPFELVRLQKGDIAIMYNVFFFKDAAVMRPESRYEVNNLLDLLNENPSYKIMIHGHTNGNASGKIIRMDKPENFYSLTGTKQGIGSAKLLSEERALVIREFLISSGVVADRMQVKAWGGKKPIHDKHSVRANENVRVEIEILSE